MQKKQKHDNRNVTKLFIAEPAQRYFLLLQFGILLTTLVFLLSIIMGSVVSVMEPSFRAINSPVQLVLFFEDMISTLFLKISLLFVGVFFINALLGLFFLERLTGPLVRIRKALEEIGSGRIPDSDVYLRKGDFPQDVGQALSGAVAYLRRKKTGI